MKSAIIYASKNGTTDKIVQKIKDIIGNGDVELINIKTKNNIDLFLYDQVIIGGSIHAGSIQKKIKKFCNKNIVQLIEKRLALFITCFHEGETAQMQLENAYSEVLLKNAISVKIFGGEMIVDKMNFFEKIIVKKVSGITKNTSKYNETEVVEFVDSLIKK